MRVYGAASAVAIALFPFLPDTGRIAASLAVGAGGVAGVVWGWRAVPPGQRRPWTLLSTGLTAILAGSAVPLIRGPWTIALGWLLDAGGNVLLLAAALAFVVRRGAEDIGSIIDTSIVALAAGGILWGVLLPHQLGLDRTPAAQLNLFVALFALTGVLGALLRLAHSVVERGSPLWWLGAALALAIGTNVTLSVAYDDPALHALAQMLAMAAFAAIGMFGLDPDAPRLLRRSAIRPGPERLSIGRLVFLGAAVAVLPVVIGFRDVVGGAIDGPTLAVQGVLVAALVMVRIGLLSAQRAQAERALRHQATHDALTRLPNRREFVSRLRDMLATGRSCLLLFCDLDDFKSINDRFGHDVGDLVLAEVADRLRSSARASDIVSRFGGDEFVILLVDATPEEGHATADRIARALARPFPQARGASIRASIGVSFARGGPEDAEELIRAADRAMYRVKASHVEPASDSARARSIRAQ